MDNDSVEFVRRTFEHRCQEFIASAVGIKWTANVYCFNFPGKILSRIIVANASATFAVKRISNRCKVRVQTIMTQLLVEISDV